MFGLCTKHLLLTKDFRNILLRSFFNSNGVKYCKAEAGCPPRTSSEKRLLHIEDECDVFDIPKGHSAPYRKFAYFMMAVIGGLAVQVFSSREEVHQVFVPYDYMYIRTKQWFFGDHRSSFFQGPNPIPEDELPNYKKQPNIVDEDLRRRKELRDLHAKEELERRKLRHEQEALAKS